MIPKKVSINRTKKGPAVPNAPASKTDIMIEKAELISNGVFFSIGLFITWTAHIDSNSYYHLAYSTLTVWTLLLSIVVGVISHKRDRLFTAISGVLYCTQLSCLLFCSYFCQSTLQVPALAITLINTGQTCQSLWIVIARFVVAVFWAAACSSVQPNAKAAAVVVAADACLLAAKAVRNMLQKSLLNKGIFSSLRKPCNTHRKTLCGGAVKRRRQRLVR